MENIYNSIKSALKKHPAVSQSVLGKVPVWKRSQYVILAGIINDDLADSPYLTEARKLEIGSAISPVTLQRFFENDYQAKTHNDLRFLKTLDKLCIFLGNKDLNTYIKENFGQTTTSIEDDIFFERNLIYDFNRSQFEALKDCPNIKLDVISQYIDETSPLYARIEVFIADHIKNNLTFLSQNNRSNYEIFKVEKIADEPELKVVKTQEFWNLVFLNKEQEHLIIHHLNTQFYFIRKQSNGWKIWDNYNPDFGKILKIN